ncbi:hypothetical protein AVEN_77870-1 [Araneus ventricosus]|uniref:DDE-1 domain-containing protein n=1 Tax=Araneus ventricosus TaxID=182803 RepID=A0A4Y2PK43_ARAVE|nr:hypothetical protein AVEN_77870-1 [Araneus ventricosus]
MPSAERGTLFKLAVAVSVIGNKIPPLFIFLRLNFKDQLLNGATRGSTGCCNSSGWMKEENCIYFAEHSVLYTKSTKERPSLRLLFIYDPHLSISALIYLKANRIVVLSFPPYCSDKLRNPWNEACMVR